MKKSSLVVAGSGIKFFSHLTVEVKTYVEQSDKVLFLVNEPAMKEWIKNANPNSESLDKLYTKYDLRLTCYRVITDYILEELEKTQHICVVLYGHPTIFAIPALEAARKAKQQGYQVKILPGISADACLYADLLINPASHGLQSFETTDFLLRNRKPDPTCHLILWQVGNIGILNHRKKIKNQKNAKILVDFLLEFYDHMHSVVLYEAAQYPYFEPRIDIVPLCQLPKQIFTPISTLYVPPSQKAPLNAAMLKKLKINKSELQ